MKNEHLKGHLDLLLLQIVDGAPAHGYQIVCALRERSEGAFDLAEGTVYPALHRLESQGLLDSEWDTSGPRRRRMYRVTGSGHEALQTQRSEWSRFVQSVGRVLSVPA